MFFFANPFESPEMGAHVPQGDDFRALWRALPRRRRRAVTKEVGQLRTGKSRAEAELFAGLAWRMQTNLALMSSFVAVFGLVVVFATINGDERWYGLLGVVLVAPVGYIWHTRRLTAALLKNVLAAERLHRLERQEAAEVR